VPDDARAARLRGFPHPKPSLPFSFRRVGLALAAWVLPALAAAQAPLVTPDVPPDEVDFEGFTSLSLGSGARAFGMGGAFLARADDATAASWNPAGLSYLRRPEFSIVGARNSFSRGSFGVPPNDELVGYTPDFLALTYPLSSGSLQLSYQRVFSFRGNRTINRGRTRFETQGEGGFDVIALGSGWRIGRSVRVGGTVNRWVNGYSQRRVRSTLPDAVGNPVRGSTEQDIDYDLNSGINFNVGVMWTPVESLNVGAVGKTPFTAIANLRRFRMDTPTSTDERVTTNSAERSDVLIDFPGAFGVGVSWRPESPLTISADYTRTFWSQGRIRNFFRLDITPQVGDPPAPADYRELLYPTLDDLEQTDTTQFRLGVEYVVIAGGLKIPLRAGVFTDRQYFRGRNSEDRPPVFGGVTVGTGLSFGPFLVDVAYVLERGRFVSRDESAERVSTRFSRGFVSIIYRHGQ
jgi:long-subunit fatty acid transport protein